MARSPRFLFSHSLPSNFSMDKYVSWIHRVNASSWTVDDARTRIASPSSLPRDIWLRIFQIMPTFLGGYYACASFIFCATPLMFRGERVREWMSPLKSNCNSIRFFLVSFFFVPNQPKSLFIFYKKPFKECENKGACLKIQCRFPSIAAALDSVTVHNDAY